MLTRLFKKLFAQQSRTMNERMTAGERLAAYDRGETNEIWGNSRDWMPPEWQLENSDETYARHQLMLRKRFEKAPEESDIYWSILQEKYAAAVRCKQWQEAMFYLQGMAFRLAEEENWEKSLAKVLSMLVYRVNGPVNLYCIDGKIDPTQLDDVEFSVEHVSSSAGAKYSDIQKQVQTLKYSIDDVEKCFWKHSKNYWIPTMPMSVEETWNKIRDGLLADWPSTNSSRD